MPSERLEAVSYCRQSRWWLTRKSGMFTSVTLNDINIDVPPLWNSR